MRPYPILGARFAIAWQPLSALILGLGVLSSAAGSDQSPVRSESQVRQILDAQCVKCHGFGKLEGGLDLRHDLTMLRGVTADRRWFPASPTRAC